MVFILALLPTLLFAQQDSTKQVFKIGKPKATITGRCKVVLAGKYSGDGKAKLSDILNSPKITMHACGDSARVIHFMVSIGISGVYCDMATSGDSLSIGMLGKLQQMKSGDYLVLKNIIYKSGNDTTYISGMVLRVLKQ